MRRDALLLASLRVQNALLKQFDPAAEITDFTDLRPDWLADIYHHHRIESKKPGDNEE